MIEWNKLFTFSLAPLQIVVRGSAMFWFLFCVFRFVLRRVVGDDPRILDRRRSLLRRLLDRPGR